MTAVRQLRPSRPVRIDPEVIARALDELPDAKVGTKSFPWTPELDELLLKYWMVKYKRDVCRLLGCTDNTARKRYRELTEK